MVIGVPSRGSSSAWSDSRWPPTSSECSAVSVVVVISPLLVVSRNIVTNLIDMSSRVAGGSLFLSGARSASVS